MENMLKCQYMMTTEQKPFRLFVLTIYFKLIGMGLSRQTNTSIPQQNNL